MLIPTHVDFVHLAYCESGIETSLVHEETEKTKMFI